MRKSLFALELSGRTRKCVLSGVAILNAVAAFGDTQGERVIANPLSLEYQFQPDKPSRREAADPVCLLYEEDYYLFASKSSGYWRSKDLTDWDYIPCKSIATINEYAPTVMSYDGYMYFLASDVNRLYRNATPWQDTWEEVEFDFPHNQHDPYLFKDDDGRIYMYWGCSNVNPIVGVELDPTRNFSPTGEPVSLIGHNARQYGWEEFGPDNNSGEEGWNEGAAMIKKDGKYYLQYAGNGTEFRNYGDGCYVSDRPLGPFTYLPESPFSYKPGGFIAGAGHGDTFRDKDGRFWHIATMRISNRHMFERRLALYPVSFDPLAGPVAHTAFSDYPFDMDGEPKAVQSEPLTNLLSYGKAVKASSCLPGHEEDKAVDEQVETWWSAATGHEGEWLIVDLGQKMAVNAIQVNFADEGFTNLGSAPVVPYRYRVEGSKDGRTWKELADFSGNVLNRPHRLHRLSTTKSVRYVKITNCGDLPGKFSLFGLRVFGKAKISVPSEVTNVIVSRETGNSKHITVSWDEVASATGYLVEWGKDVDHLTHATTVLTNVLDARWFNRDQPYEFKVRAFNEGGIGK